MPHLTTRTEPDIKAAFSNRAKAQGLNESELLRRLVLAELEKSDAAEPVKPEVDPEGNQTNTERMTIRMPCFLMEATKKMAKGKGMAPSRWVTALVQSNIIRQPVMSDAEIIELRASNRALVALGRNINQIARAINANAYGEADRSRLDRLIELGEVITENREAIRALVRASQNVWKA